MTIARSVRTFWTSQAPQSAAAALSVLRSQGYLSAVFSTGHLHLREFEPAVERSFSTDLPSTAYQQELEQLRSKIFGTHIGNNLPSGRKLLRKPLIGDKIANYYIESFAKTDHLYVDERIERYAGSRRSLSCLRNGRN